MNHSPIKPGALRQHNIHSSMFTPRPYQIELVERALKRNTIACLNSASGKSFIWMTYLREMLSLNFRQVVKGVSQANAIVLFSSDYQAKEHGSTLKNHMNFHVEVVPTESGLALSIADWKKITTRSRIIVTTPKVVTNAFGNLLYKAHQIGVLILDECDEILYPESEYSRIMQVLNDAQHKPCILGLTCSLLKESSSAQLEKDIRSMEQHLHSKAETATDLIALDGHSPTQPDEKIVLCSSLNLPDKEKENPVENSDKLCSEIRSILLHALEWLKVCQITSNTKITKAEVQEESVSDDKQNLNLEADSNLLEGNKESHQEKIVQSDSVKNNIKNQNVLNHRQDHPTSNDNQPEEPDVEEFRNMSLTVLSQVLLVLDVLGPWCAHRLVILLLKQLQKSIHTQDSVQKCESLSSKWKYFLLRYTDSHLRTVYTLYQTYVGNQKKVDLKLVTPKVNRLLQVLKEYKPPEEPEKKESSRFPKYNDRSEAGYISWWQDSDAEEDDEETQMMMEGNKKKVEEWNAQESKPGSGKMVRQYHHGNTLCGIVFVKEKYVAVMLQRLLKEVSKEDNDLRHVSSAHITSLATPSPQSGTSEGTHMTEDIYNTATNTEKQKQEEVLRSFRSHEINLLVSTNCLEEYAEIPKCNLVLRFDVPTTYKSYILSKSRARSSNSTYMMLVHDKEKSEFMVQLQEYKKIEKVLQGSVCEKQSNKPPVDYDYFDVKDSDSDEEDERAKVPPYYSGPNTCVTLDSAIHIINRYCSRLPSDPFTHLNPRCEIFEVSVKSLSDSISEVYPTGRSQAYECSLQLPINSHVRNPIKGPQMSTALLAQKAVALEACRLLHNSGELDDHFLPIGKEMVKYAEELDPWPEEKSKVPGRPGTTKRRQTYEKETPVTLSNCLPAANTPLFLYEIRMKLETPMPEELNVRRRRLHAPEETTRCFGILTTKPLPRVLGFPLFTRSGEESVHIHLCRSFITLGEHHIKMIRSFHHYIFSDMLRIDRVPLVFKPDAAPMQILVVILNKSSPTSNLDIDWKFMCQISTKRRIEERMKNDPWFRHKHFESKGGKNAFVFKRSKYEDGVVVAKYRSPDQPNRFYVAEIKDELDPYSSFPSTEYESFHHYYRIKYGLNISCLNQPLLDVDHTSSRLNLLTPRYMNQKGKALPVSSLEKKRAKYETLMNRQILVPELCDLHPIPASLWRKAVCIPSVIYRLSSILVAEELRGKIAVESGIGQQELPLGWEWSDLDFGWDTDRSEDRDESNSATSTVEDLKTEQKENHDENGGQVDSAEEGVSQVETSLSSKENNSSSEKNGQENHENTSEDPKIRPVPSDNKIDEVTEQFKALNVGEMEKQLEIKSDENTQKKHASGSPQTPVTSDSDISSDSDQEAYQNHFNLTDDENEPKHGKKKKHKKEEDKPKRSYSLYRIPKSKIENAALQSAEGKSDIGPSPGLILQALTLSNASDGFNLERLEMLGDSFLKHAVTVYLFCTYPDAHEGKLSYMRSKKVSNYNLYRIGQQRNLPGKMTALIFDPAVNWLPPGYIIGTGGTAAEDEGICGDSRCDSLDDEMEIGVWTGVPGSKSPLKPEPAPDQASNSTPKPPHEEMNIESAHGDEDEEEEEEEIYDEDEIQMIDNMLGSCLVGRMNGLRGTSHPGDRRQNGFSSFTGRSMQFVDRNVLLHARTKQNEATSDEFVIDTWTPVDADGKPLCATDPLLIDLHTQHSLADKSIADCVEAILGAYLTTCGHRAAQILLCYFGLKVLPKVKDKEKSGSIPTYGFLKEPTNVLLDESSLGRKKLSLFTKELEAFEKKINYTFKDKAYLLQAFTHASYYINTITDCYQRLEFLGDAILDFLITCQLFNDPRRRHSPGALTDLRSALVNNTIFASLAVRHDFHKFFKAISPELHHIIDGFVRYQQQQEEAQGMDAQLAKRYCPTNDVADELDTILVSPDVFTDQDDVEEEEEEDVEVPKALGDIFESVAGAIYMDSGMDLDEVWRVYEPMMAPLIEKFTSCVPRAPVRELLEMEPETAKFSWAEKRADGKVRVTVEVIGKGSFKGVGRSYRIAKSAAARRALRFLKSNLNDD